MRKIIITLAAFGLAYAATAQKQKTTDQSDKDTFFIVDPLDAKFYKEHPKEMAKADAGRKLIRDEEYKRTKVRWMPLKDAGVKARDMILKSDPSLLDNLRQSGLYMDVAFIDFDHDGKPDLVFYNWADGRAEGYNYTVVFGKTIKPNRRFFGMTVQPYKDGILVDRAYSVL